MSIWTFGFVDFVKYFISFSSVARRLYQFSYICFFVLQRTVSILVRQAVNVSQVYRCVRTKSVIIIVVHVSEVEKKRKIKNQDNRTVKQNVQITLAHNPCCVEETISDIFEFAKESLCKLIVK